jgi:hypothetical protein
VTEPPEYSAKLGPTTLRLIVVEDVMLPDVPVMVRGYVLLPITEELAVKVRVLVPVVEAGENEAVTPPGKNDARERATLPVKPYSGTTVIVALTEPPGLSVNPLDDGARINVGVWTESVRLEVRVSEPDVPVTVIGTSCCTAELSAVNVSMSSVVAGFDANDAVTPLGSVEVTARFTPSAKPPARLIFIVVVPLPPNGTCTLLCEVVSQYPGACGPARSSIKLCPLALPHPVVRSYPLTALNHTVWLPVLLFPEVTSCRSLLPSAPCASWYNGGFRNPRPPTGAVPPATACWFTRAIKPAQRGAAKLVPA